MTHATDCFDQPRHNTWRHWLAPYLTEPSRKARRTRLDVRRLSDHLKRDMGFMDGNDPARHR